LNFERRDAWTLDVPPAEQAANRPPLRRSSVKPPAAGRVDWKTWKTPDENRPD
jgi:hypothetical protein